MVVIFCGQTAQDLEFDVWGSIPTLVTARQRFLSDAASSLAQHTDREQIHVRQGEMASSCLTGHRQALLGSSEATTCIIAAIYDRAQNRAALAHFDLRTCHQEAVDTFVQV